MPPFPPLKRSHHLAPASGKPGGTVIASVIVCMPTSTTRGG